MRLKCTTVDVKIINLCCNVKGSIFSNARLKSRNTLLITRPWFMSSFHVDNTELNDVSQKWCSLKRKTRLSVYLYNMYVCILYKRVAHQPCNAFLHIFCSYWSACLLNTSWSVWARFVVANTCVSRLWIRNNNCVRV